MGCNTPKSWSEEKTTKKSGELTMYKKLPMALKIMAMPIAT